MQLLAEKQEVEERGEGGGAGPRAIQAKQMLVAMMKRGPFWERGAREIRDIEDDFRRRNASSAERLGT